MKFIDILQPGGPEALVLREGDAPEPGLGEVRIRVAAAGVNRPDVIQRLGLYPAPPGASPIPGLEVAGEVDAIGDGVTSWKIGDKVCALANGGGYAEQVCVPAGQCLPVPEGLTLEEAAALPETCFTVWSNVFDRAALKPGETFLVHGGSSGIGTTAIQMAALWGAKVFTTAGSAEKCEACVRLGAHQAIPYREQDFVDVLRAATAGKGIDVTLDMVGGEYIGRNIKVAAVDGRIVNIAYLQGAVANVNFIPVMLKRLTLTGSTLRPQSLGVKTAIAQALLKTVWPWIEAGRMRPVMAAHFPLAKASDAHALMESNAHIGKIVLLT